MPGFVNKRMKARPRKIRIETFLKTIVRILLKRVAEDVLLTFVSVAKTLYSEEIINCL